jgi:hypothetical protein
MVSIYVCTVQFLLSAVHGVDSFGRFLKARGLERRTAHYKKTVPSRDVTKLSFTGNKLIFPGHGEFG